MQFAPLAFFTGLVAVVAAQTESAGGRSNPFNIPQGFMLTAGEETIIEWSPTTEGPVTLTLRSGVASDLDEGTVLACMSPFENSHIALLQVVTDPFSSVAGIPNSGSYAITLPEDTTRSSDYTIEISSDCNPSQVNYTPYFVVESQDTVFELDE